MRGPGSRLADEPASPGRRAPAPSRGKAWPAFVPAVLLGAATFLAMRSPRVLVEGRFWAEEGAVYFAAARGDGLSALLGSPQGYLNLAANAACAVADLPFVPLEAAARVTVFASLLVQLLPVYLLLTRRAAWLSSLSARLAAVALYVLARPSEEVWLNTANSHFVLGVAAAILLATESGESGRRASLPILVLAGLSGIAAVLLAPLFWVEALRTRSRERIAEVLVLTACALLQGAIVLAALSEGGRAARADADVFLPVLLSRLVICPFVSDGTGSEAALRLYAYLRRDGSPLLPSLAAAAGVVALSFACWRARSRAAAFLAAASVLFLATGYSGALGVDRAAHLRFVLPGESERYFWAPTVLLLLALLAVGASADPPRPVLAAFACALAAVAAIHGLGTLAASRQDAPPFYSGPSWPAEVAAWRADPSHRPRIWPSPWTIDLGPRDPGGGPPPSRGR